MSKILHAQLCWQTSQRLFGMIVPTSRTTLNEKTNITETDNKIEIRLSALQSACHNSAICITSHMPQIFQVVKDRSPQTAESHG